MAKWHVRKYAWPPQPCSDIAVVTEEIEADTLEYYEGTLVFSNVIGHNADRITVAVRARHEWFAADKVDD